MAYGNYIAAVPLGQIAELRQDRGSVLRPTRVEMVSHLVGYWIKVQPIGQALGEVLDGGELLSDAFEHPLRPPKLHLPADVARLHVALREGIKAATTAGEAREIDCFRSDIERLAAVLELAAARGETVISVLEPPFDEERAAKVRIPFAVG